MISDAARTCYYCETGVVQAGKPGRRCYECRKKSNRLNTQVFRSRHTDYYYQSSEYHNNRQLTTEQRTKANVRNLAHSAVRGGKLIKPGMCNNCLQQSDAIEAHHEDYSKPLEVIWLCNRCHIEVHIKNKITN
jgi:hypothetical protein